MLNEEAVSGDPYAMCVLGLRHLEKAKTKCEEVGEYGRAAGSYATSPDVVDYEAFNKAGQFLFLSSESAKTGGIRKLLRVASRALRRWLVDARSFNAPVLGDQVFMQRIDHVLHDGKR